MIVQRFGAALNLNVHSHALVFDGVFAEDGSGAVRFMRARRPPTRRRVAAIALHDIQPLHHSTQRGLITLANTNSATDRPTSWPAS